jgi:hypothetical protein
MAKGCCLLGIPHWWELQFQSEVILRFTLGDSENC